MAGASPTRLPRTFLWAAFALLLTMRLVDWLDQEIPATHMALTALPYLALVPLLTGRRTPRDRYLLFGATMVSALLPFALIGTDWEWLPWTVGAAALCALPARVSWPLLGLLMAAAGLLGHHLGEPTHRWVWRIAATGNDSVIIFGLHAMTHTVRQLRETRHEVARLAVLRERLRVDGELRTTVGAGLRAVAELLDRAAAGSPVEARTALSASADRARTTLAAVRAAAGGYRTTDPTAPALPPPALVSPGPARLALGLVIGLQSAKGVINAGYGWGGGRPPWIPGVLVLHCTAWILLMRPPTRTRLAAVALLVVPTAWPGALWTPALVHLSDVWGFVLGAALLVLKRRYALLCVTGAATLQILLFHYPPPVPPITAQAVDLASVGMLALIYVSLTRLGTLASRLERTRSTLADVTVAAERDRIARDLHDVLGFSLTAVALRGDLTARLVAKDPDRAAAERASLAELVAHACRELASIAYGRVHLRARRELAVAERVLRDAGISVSTEFAPIELPAELDTVLATVIREAAANVLRHSDARHCDIRITEEDSGIRLRIGNDGALSTNWAPEPSGPAPSGLRNLAQRAGGRLEARPCAEGRFEVTAHFIATDGMSSQLP